MTRKSKREIAQAVDDLTVEQLPDQQVTLAELLSYEIETVDEEAGIVRIVETGELRRSAGTSSGGLGADHLRALMNRADGEDGGENS